MQITPIALFALDTALLSVQDRRDVGKVAVQVRRKRTAPGMREDAEGNRTGMERKE
jgi:hypothetical protein